MLTPNVDVDVDANFKYLLIVLKDITRIAKLVEKNDYTRDSSYMVLSLL